MPFEELGGDREQLLVLHCILIWLQSYFENSCYIIYPIYKDMFVSVSFINFTLLVV